ncbi:MAG: HYR domain-containing protein [Phycisphaerae bacterium]|nr:HYR domain-containing protein [Saprospiraceae bacterium]
MQLKLLKSARWAFVPLFLLLAQQSWSQCLFTSPFGSATINTAGAIVTISTCSFAGEYSTISGAVSGQTLRFTSVAGDFITIRSGTSSGPVVAFGTTPLTFANTFTGTLYAHWALNAACATQSVCRTTTVQCTSCSPPPPAPNDLCTGAINIACGQTISSTTTGQGIDAVPTCGTTFGTASGVWYSFAGDNSTVTLSLCGSSYDTKIGVFSGSCAALVCVTGNDDFCGLQSQVAFVANIGTTYYVLVTGFSTASGAFTLVRTCVPLPVTPPCLASPTSPTNGQSNICPSANQTLSWPVSTGATSYDVYFGTSNPPPFVANTLTNSYIAATPTSSQYFWQIRPRGPGGVASGCAVWSFTKSDIIPPSITCPANIARNNDAGKCGAIVTYSTPTATDNCGVASIVQQSGVASGALHPVGATVNVWKASDFAGNMATCSFTVTVTDIEKPVATCPPDRTINNDPGKCSALSNINGGLGLVDNCGIASTSNNAPTPFPIGETVVVWTVRDPSNNSGTCSFKVTVKDAEPPTVHCPTNINTLTDLGDCGATVNFNVTASDNCGVGSTDLSDASGSNFGIGYTNIEFSATDVNGNVSTCAFQIIVNTRAEACNDIDDDCDGWVDEAEDWTALVKRFASDGVAAEEYGISVDIDGDYAIVGSNQKNDNGQNVGSAYILFRDKSGANKWGQLVEIFPPASSPGDQFGASVAISGGIAAIGAPQFDDQFGNQGVVFIFRQNANNPAQWDFVKILQTNDPASADNFGASVALDGDRLLAGAPFSDASGNNSGAAYMFYRNLGGADNWGQQAKLLATTGAADDNMGGSVALDGDYAIVGANGVDGLFQNAGAAYIFGRNTAGLDAWGQVVRIRANQTGQNDNFGASVGISGPWAIVGADRNDLKGTDAGAAFIFYKNRNGINNSWGQSQILLNNNGQAGDRLGSGVGIDEPYAVVASKGDNPFGAGSGGGFVYLLDVNTWVQVDQLTDGGGDDDDALGSSAAISGRNIILGEPLDNNGANSNQGAVIVYGGLCNNFAPGNEDRNDIASISETSVHCFPVPFSDVLNIEVKGMKAADANLTIVNAMGQVVTELYKGTIEGDMLFQWQPTQAADGLYFLRMNTGEKVVTQTIVRTR